ncbi:MAG: acetyl-CoA carboxylase carboxyltransferase subunit alpha [Eubacterium sp.]|jgi:acetyl-CoA carboxylase carboxyl transferase subunit alpha|nr:acetyl-CoA carboxylase carboxyltransferase subunit alpha [Eubacterium sp.]MEE3399774.1 acetyl-CoA carboxylase carboxyltransferase subunit alpha [Eubacterium sp.]
MATIRDIDKKLTELEDQIAAINDNMEQVELLSDLHAEYDKTATEAADLTPADKVFLARHIRRPKVDDYIEALFDDFFEQRGDILNKEDKSIYGGIASFHGVPVTVLGHRKGRDLQENMEYNFGMPEPEGYRKALRLMKQAEKFGRPIITFIDTPGAYPGLDAEAHGQSQAISRNLAEMSALKVPVIAIVTGEGSSGGALAIGVANSVYMLENAVYSVLSPEGFASILWKDSSKADEACKLMKLTAQDLLHFGVIEGIINEPLCGAHHNPSVVYRDIDEMLVHELRRFKGKSGSDIAKDRYEKFRHIDSYVLG